MKASCIVAELSPDPVPPTTSVTAPLTPRCLGRFNANSVQGFHGLVAAAFVRMQKAIRRRFECTLRPQLNAAGQWRLDAPSEQCKSDKNSVAWDVVTASEESARLNGGAHQVRLNDGRTTFGRAELSTGLSGEAGEAARGLLKQVSKSQLVCWWDSEAGTLRAASVRSDGKQISYHLQRSPDGTTRTQLVPLFPTSGDPAGPPAEVSDGDVLTLFLGWLPLVCEMKEVKHAEPSHVTFPKRYSNPGKAAVTAGVHGMRALRHWVDTFKGWGGEAASRALEDTRVFYCDRNCVLSYDLFPKGRVHLLGFVLEDGMEVGAVSDLRAKHLPALKRLHSIAEQAVQHIKTMHAAQGFDMLSYQIGYHATPSLKPLHLHVMSTDFQEPTLKNKKHYVSFCPPHFVESSTVEAMLTAQGCVTLPSAAHASTGLECRWCAERQNTIPALKQHMLRCSMNPNTFM